MCYSGKCPVEDYMGECTLSQKEFIYLKDNYNISCLSPMCFEEVDNPIFDEALEGLYEYKYYLETIKELTGRWYI